MIGLYKGRRWVRFFGLPTTIEGNESWSFHKNNHAIEIKFGGLERITGNRYRVLLDTPITFGDGTIHQVVNSTAFLYGNFFYQTINEGGDDHYLIIQAIAIPESEGGKAKLPTQETLEAQLKALPWLVRFYVDDAYNAKRMR